MHFVFTRGNDLRFFSTYAVDFAYKLLNLWVTLEIYSRLMTSYPALRKISAKVLWVSIIALLTISAMVYRFSDLHGLDSLMAALNSISRSFRIVQLGLLTVIFLIARSFHLRLRPYYNYIAIGLIIIDCSELIALSIYAMTQYSTYGVHAGNLLRMIASLLVQIMWIRVLFAGEGVSPAGTPADLAALPFEQIDGWNYSLGAFGRSR